MDTNKLNSWNQPIGGLIAQFIDFDRDAVADLQAQLLAIQTHEASTDAEKTDLFRLRLNDISSKIDDLAIDEKAIADARAVVDSGQGMPGGVPPLGLIAKMHGFVDFATCDTLLSAQAGARTILYADADNDALPGASEAVNDRLFAFVGKSDKEPAELVEAQSVAHMALMHRAMRAERGLDPLTNELNALGTHALAAAQEKLHGLSQLDAAAELTEILSDNAPQMSKTQALGALLPVINEDMSVLHAQGKISLDDTKACSLCTNRLGALAYPQTNAPGQRRNFDQS